VPATKEISSTEFVYKKSQINLDLKLKIVPIDLDETINNGHKMVPSKKVWVIKKSYNLVCQQLNK